LRVIHDLLILLRSLAPYDFVLHLDASGDLRLDILVSLRTPSDDFLFNGSSLDFLY
jgi:hypothetical protein